jgi:hypothetical protein
MGQKGWTHSEVVVVVVVVVVKKVILTSANRIAKPSPLRQSQLTPAQKKTSTERQFQSRSISDAAPKADAQRLKKSSVLQTSM